MKYLMKWLSRKKELLSKLLQLMCTLIIRMLLVEQFLLEDVNKAAGKPSNSTKETEIGAVELF